MQTLNSNLQQGSVPEPTDINLTVAGQSKVTLLKQESTTIHRLLVFQIKIIVHSLNLIIYCVKGKYGTSRI